MGKKGRENPGEGTNAQTEVPTVAPAEGAEAVKETAGTPRNRDEVAATVRDTMEEISGSVMKIETFLNEGGKVQTERVKEYKNVIPTSVLETLNQLQPGILFDLFVVQEGEDFRIDFAGNEEADKQIGLSQILRGKPQNPGSIPVPLEGARELTVTEDDGNAYRSKRKGLAGNFYAEGVYQEVHNNYRFKVESYETGGKAKIDEAVRQAREKTGGVPTQFMEGFEWDGIAAAGLEWSEEDGHFVKAETSSSQQLLEYVMIEASLQGLDPDLVLAVVKGSQGEHMDRDQFEDKFQWTLRALQEYETHYVGNYDKPAKEGGHYTAEFVAHMVEFPMALDVIDHEKLLKNYGELIGRTLTLPSDFEMDSHDPKHAFDDIETVGGAGIRAIVPRASRISSGFGRRKRPKTKTGHGSSNHGGLDIAARRGARINAFAAGVVKLRTKSSSAGNYLVIDHGNGMETVYMHCRRIVVKQGQRVSAGQKIATVGSTGNSSGPHLHFEVRNHGVKQNPMRYLAN